MNGKFSYAVVPLYSREQGIASEEIQVEVKNSLNVIIIDLINML